MRIIHKKISELFEIFSVIEKNVTIEIYQKNLISRENRSKSVILGGLPISDKRLKIIFLSREFSVIGSINFANYFRVVFIIAEQIVLLYEKHKNFARKIKELYNIY